MFYKVLQQIMDEQGIKVPEVAKRTGLADSTIRSIIYRKTKTIALEVAFKFSDGLGVPLERLGGIDKKSNIKQAHIPILDNLQDERLERIIKFYYLFNEKGRDRLLDSAREFSEINRYLTAGGVSSTSEISKEIGA